MLQAALADGTAERRSVFELFARRLPDGRRYGVVAGVNRLLDALERFRFDEQTIAFLADRGVVDQATRDWLGGDRVSAANPAHPPAGNFFPRSPVLLVGSAFPQGAGVG